MPKIKFVEHTGVEHVIDAPVGLNLMMIAVRNFVDGISGVCGGQCACATCHCYVDDAWQDRVPAMASLEEEMLDEVVAERRVGSRLSCQISITDELDGLVVHLPDRQ